jgi:hypothetical protein
MVISEKTPMLSEIGEYDRTDLHNVFMLSNLYP